MLVVYCFVFSGCGKETNQIVENDASGLKMAPADEAKTELTFRPNTTFAGLLTSIDKLEKLDCKYLVEDEETLDEIESHIYIEGEKYKSITYTKNGDTLYSIFDGDNFYSWSKMSEQGFRMSKSCAATFEGAEQDLESDEEFELDSYKTSGELFDENVVINCEKTSYVDITVPSEIVFVDHCEMLRKQIDQIKHLQ